MKKLGIFTVILVALILQSGCYADKGDYDYRDINELTIILPESREVFTGRPLRIVPEIIPSINITENLNWDNYYYEWIAVRNNNSNIAVFLGSERDLDIIVPTGMEEGDYVVFYTVGDKRTGIETTERFFLRVSGGLTVGWLILNDINGSSRLDMLPLNSGQFNFVNDVLGSVDDSLRLPAERMQSRPLGLARFICNLSPDRLAFYILTETHSSRIRLRNFVWRDNYDISFNFVPPFLAPPNFAASTLRTDSDVTFIMTGKDANGRHNAYYYNRILGTMFWSHPINTLDLGGTFFNVSPKHTAQLIFDTDSRSIYQFRQNASQTGVGSAVIDEGAAGRNIIRSYRNMGMDLVEMLANHIRPTGLDLFYTFILRNPTNGEYWFLRANSGLSQTHWERLSTTIDGSAETIDWSQVKLFATGGEFTESLYFVLGGKVYAYNLSDRRSFLMLDKGPGYEITYLNFFSAPGMGRQGSDRDIFIASFDGTQGTLERYEIFIRPNPFVIAHFHETEIEFRFGPDTRFVDPATGEVSIGTQFGRIVDIHYKSP